MTNSLIVALSTLFLLTACCNGDGDPNCTQAEKQERANRDAPKLIAVQDGVKLYCWRCWASYPVYFTTPCGDVHWNEHHGKATTTQQQVNGTGCK